MDFFRIVREAPLGDPSRELLGALRGARFLDTPSCPRCGCAKVHRWGTFSGRQRYKCVDGCGRTFSDLTGTPAAYSKKLLQWPAYGRCMEEGLSVRATANRLGLHPSTAFRWRHRLLGWLAAHDDEPLTGWVELDLVRFVESRKGERALERAPRRRAVTPQEWFRTPRANVAVAVDRAGHAVTALVQGVGQGEEVARLLTFLDGRLRPPAGTCQLISSQRQILSWAVSASSLPGPFHYMPRTRSPMAGVALVRDYGRRLRQWVRRFRGVATRYLPNYLIWHRMADEPFRHALADVVLRWPLAPP